MADGDNSIALYDIIRKELNLIISDGDTATKNTYSTSIANNKSDDDDKCRKPQDTTEVTDNLIDDSGNINEQPTAREHLSTLLSSKILQLPSNETPGAAIDMDLQKMRFDLQQSYELFQAMAERFQAINFRSLKSRIKDMNLNKSDRSSKLEQEVKDVLKMHYDDNTLSSLTSEMGVRFQQHPGEFGNIPELSEFFQTCTQLQNGLEQIKRQRHSVGELTKRITNAAEASYARIDYIHSIMSSRKSGQCPVQKN